MMGIREKLKRRSRLKWAKSIRQIRDWILICDSPEICVKVTRKYLGMQNNTISYGGQFNRCWAKVSTEFRTFPGWGNTELEAMKMAGIRIYKSRRDYFLSQ